MAFDTTMKKCKITLKHVFDEISCDKIAPISAFPARDALHIRLESLL